MTSAIVEDQRVASRGTTGGSTEPEQVLALFLGYAALPNTCYAATSGRQPCTSSLIVMALASFHPLRLGLLRTPNSSARIRSACIRDRRAAVVEGGEMGANLVGFK
jgi:hypothetical protein